MTPAHARLKQSPIYKNALLTPNVMKAISPDYVGTTLWPRRNYDPSIHHNKQVVMAGKKLDHIIRHALGDWDYISPRQISVMRAFLELFEQTLPRMNLTATVRQGIDARIAFCREIISAAQAEGNDNSADSADEFRAIIIRHGKTVADVIYNNPFETYASGYHGGYIADLYYAMSHYWE
jgi:hypothetical protein